MKKSVNAVTIGWSFLFLCNYHRRIQKFPARHTAQR